MSENVGDNDLQQLFKPFGSIARTFLAKDKNTGQCKVRENAKKINGRATRVNIFQKYDNFAPLPVSKNDIFSPWYSENVLSSPFSTSSPLYLQFLSSMQCSKPKCHCELSMILVNYLLPIRIREGEMKPIRIRNTAFNMIQGCIFTQNRIFFPTPFFKYDLFPPGTGKIPPFSPFFHPLPLYLRFFLINNHIFSLANQYFIFLPPRGGDGKKNHP